MIIIQGLWNKRLMGKISFLVSVNKRNVDVAPWATVLILKTGPSTIPFKILPEIGNSKTYTTKHTHRSKMANGFNPSA